MIKKYTKKINLLIKTLYLIVIAYIFYLVYLGNKEQQLLRITNQYNEKADNTLDIINLGICTAIEKVHYDSLYHAFVDSAQKYENLYNQERLKKEIEHLKHIKNTLP